MLTVEKAAGVALRARTVSPLPAPQAAIPPSPFPSHPAEGQQAPRRANAGSRPPQSRGQGAAPPPGVQRLPLFLTTSEGGPVGQRRTPSQTPPLIEGAGQDKTIRPHRRADAGVRDPCHTPLAKYERVCYSTPMKSAPARFSFSEPAACGLGESIARVPLWQEASEGTCPRPARPLRERLGPERMPLRHKLSGAAKARLGFAIARDGS